MIRLLVWDATGSRRLSLDDGLPDGRTEPSAIVEAVRLKFGLDTAFLRVAATDLVELELLSATLGPWVDHPMTPRAEQRPAWHRPGWWHATVDQATDELARLGIELIGRPWQARHTTLTGLICLPTTAGTLWLKATPRLFAAEGPVIRELGRIAPGVVPEVVVQTDDWWISTDFPKAADEAPHDYLPLLADLQIASLDRLAELRAAGCPDRPISELPEAVARVAQREDLLSTQLRAQLESCVDNLSRVCAQVDSLGFPATVLHGDLNPENVLWTGDHWFVFDWTDTCISHPFADIELPLSHAGPADRAAAYGAKWTPLMPQESVERALAAAPIIGSAFQVANYARILDVIEPTAADRSCGAQLTGLLAGWAARLYNAGR